MVQEQGFDRLSCSQTVLEGVGRVGMLCLVLLGLTLLAQLTLGDFRTVFNWTKGDPIILDKGDFVHASLNPKVKGEDYYSHEGDYFRARRSHFLPSISDSKGGHCQVAREGGGSGEGYTSGVGSGREEVPPSYLAGSNVERDAHDEDTYYGTFIEVVQPQGSNISSLATPKPGVRSRVQGMKKRSLKPVSHQVGGVSKMQGLKKRSPATLQAHVSHNKAGAERHQNLLLEQIHSASYKAGCSDAAQRQQKRSPLPLKVDSIMTQERQDGVKGQQKRSLNQVQAGSSKAETSQDKSEWDKTQGPSKRSLHPLETASNTSHGEEDGAQVLQKHSLHQAQVESQASQKAGGVGQESRPVKRSPPPDPPADPKRTLKVAGLIVDAVLGQAEAAGMNSELGLCKGNNKITNPERSNGSEAVFKDVLLCVDQLVNERLPSRNCKTLGPDLSAFLQWLLHGRSSLVELPGPPRPRSPFELIFHEDPHAKHEGVPEPKRAPRRAVQLEADDEDAQFEESLKAYIASLLRFSGDDPEFQPKPHLRKRFFHRPHHHRHHYRRYHRSPQPCQLGYSSNDDS